MLGLLQTPLAIALIPITIWAVGTVEIYARVVKGERGWRGTCFAILALLLPAAFLPAVIIWDAIDQPLKNEGVGRIGYYFLAGLLTLWSYALAALIGTLRIAFGLVRDRMRGSGTERSSRLRL